MIYFWFVTSLSIIYIHNQKTGLNRVSDGHCQNGTAVLLAISIIVTATIATAIDTKPFLDKEDHHKTQIWQIKQNLVVKK